MYEAFRLKVLLAVWKGQYCERDFAACERYRLREAGKPVPEKLLPDGAMLR